MDSVMSTEGMRVVTHDVMEITGPDGAGGALTSFANSAVVQLVRGEPSDPSAVVEELHSATVTVDMTRIAAVDGDVAWEWLVSDIERIVHATDGSWSILVVPEISDFGVAIAHDRATEFRRIVGTIPGLAIELQASENEATPPSVGVPSPVDARPDTSPLAPPTPSAPSTSPEPLFVLPPPTLEGPHRITEPVRITEVSAAVIGLPLPAAPSLADTLMDSPPERTHAEATSVTAIATAAAGNQIEADSDHRRPARVRVRERSRGKVTSLHQLAPLTSLAGIEARDISAWFGSHHVLDRVSLDMAAGQVTALIGPSGCGKSTFLRILNRMHEMIPSASMAGEVLLEGHDIYDSSRKLTDARREIGMVFQKPNPFPAMSIYDNVLASLQLTGVKATTDVKDELVESCLSKAGLWLEVRDRLRSPGGGLSGGQQQRLCIARALAIRPRVLLMDEPCSALDPTSTRRIEETITQLVSEVTIVIVTHNMQQAVRVSNQCAFFLAQQGTPGAIVEHGPTAAMFGSPQDDRTNDYVNGRFG